MQVNDRNSTFDAYVEDLVHFLNTYRTVLNIKFVNLQTKSPSAVHMRSAECRYHQHLTVYIRNCPQVKTSPLLVKRLRST